MDLFIFGTLLHRPLLRMVAGEDCRTAPMRLPGHRVARVAGEVFPMLTSGEGADGLLITGASEEAIARIDYYEAAFGYARHPVTLETPQGDKQGGATVYLPAPGRWQPAEDWSLTDWADAWGALTVETAKEAMSLMGQISPEEMGRRYGSMMNRADGRLRAASQTPTDGMTRADVELMSLRQPFGGYFAVDELTLRHRRFDGTMSATMNREVWALGDAMLVLPYDPVRDRVLLVEQFRVGPYLRGDLSPWLLEPIAGRIDPGETPEAAARREAEEEAGLTLGALELIADGYPSPGTTSEHFHIFLGLADLPDDITGSGGLDSEDEDIRSHLLTWAEFDAALMAGSFKLVPLELAGHWLARNRDRLRSSA